MAEEILIVEDDEDIVELLLAIFEGFNNYRILCAKDGEEALGIVRAEKPSIVLLDIQLPKLNGFELCKLIKSDPTLSRAKILMITGMAQNSDWSRAEDAGADGYVTKPFTAVELIKKVEELSNRAA